MDIRHQAHLWQYLNLLYFRRAGGEFQPGRFEEGLAAPPAAWDAGVHRLQEDGADGERHDERADRT